MRAVTVIKDDRERRRIARLLANAGFEVNEAASVAAAREQLDVDIAFVDVGSVSAVREAARRVFLIAVVSATPSPSDYWTAYHAGADDVMRVSACKEEVLGRAGALARIRAWARPPLTDRLTELVRGMPLDEIVGYELGEMVGHPFTRHVPAPSEIVLASDIGLTLVEEHLEIRFGLGIERDALPILQRVLLGGDTSTEAVADAMRELANTAAGAIKRAALGFGFDLTIGLPTNTQLVANDALGCRAWRLASRDGIVFSCVSMMRTTAPQLVIARDLREGMVLARDVRNHSGMLIASAGTNLTRTTVEKLTHLLGAQSAVEISHHAA